MFVHSRVPYPPAAGRRFRGAPDTGYLDRFSKERRLILMLAIVAALACVPLFLGFASSGSLGWTEIALFAGASATLVSVVVLSEIYTSLSRKLIQLHGAHADANKENAVDTLTGAYARTEFLRMLDQAIRKRGDFGSVALIVFDIDHFKQINDSLGHPAGDDVLTFCAQAAKSTFHDAVVGRLGGDEFAVFFAHSEPIGGAYISDACDSFLSFLRRGLPIGHRRHQLSASIGIAMAPSDDTNVDVLLSYADMALYEAKRAGRGRYARFDKKILADARHERFVERELRAAIILDQLTVHYQPIVDAQGELYSLEALVRWDHPVRGIISPGDFIRIAEKSSLIHDLGLDVLRHVCRDIPRLPKVPININVSARQIGLQRFKQDYVDTLEQAGVDPARIILEITESAMLETSGPVVARIAGLQEAGFRIALDDFGLGYSEFNQLRALPFDIIKIDKSFIQNIGADSVTDVFVSAVVQIAQRLERVVIAEGIETVDDVERASIAGCRLFQGIHFHAPARCEDIIAAYGDRACIRVA